MILRSRHRLARRTRAGFTLVEMLIVIALIAVIGTLTIGKLGNIFGGAQEDVALQFVRNSLSAPLLKYRIDTGSYPSTEQGLQALVAAPSGVKAGKWKGPYIERLQDDPWGKPYQYRFPGVKNVGGYDVWSLGTDGVESADDIGNWEK